MRTAARRGATLIALAITIILGASATGPAQAVQTSSITGVATLAGAPLEGKHVILRIDDGTYRATLTDDTGRFTFTAPVGTTYTVELRSSARSLVTYAGDTLRAPDATWSTLGAGTDTVNIAAVP